MRRALVYFSGLALVPLLLLLQGCSDSGSDSEATSVSGADQSASAPGPQPSATDKLSATEKSYLLSVEKFARDEVDASTQIRAGFEDVQYDRDSDGNPVAFSQEWQGKMIAACSNLHAAASYAYHLDVPPRFRSSNRILKEAVNEMDNTAANLPIILESDTPSINRLKECMAHYNHGDNLLVDCKAEIEKEEVS